MTAQHHRRSLAALAALLVAIVATYGICPCTMGKLFGIGDGDTVEGGDGGNDDQCRAIIRIGLQQPARDLDGKVFLASQQLPGRNDPGVVK